MRFIDLLTEAMQPLSIVFAKIKHGLDGAQDSSCYNRVGRMLRAHGDELSDAVIAFYALPGRDSYNHVAIESPDGVLIDERKAPPGFRDANGRAHRSDMTRSVLRVPDVLAYLSTVALQSSSSVI